MSLELDDAHYRAEDLFFRDLHVIFHIGKNRRLNKVAFVAHSVPAMHQFRTFRFTGLDVAHHLIELFLVYLRALFRRRVERIANRTLLGARHALFHKLVVGLFFDEQARTGATALALIEEQRKMRAFNRIIHDRRRQKRCSGSCRPVPT